MDKVIEKKNKLGKRILYISLASLVFLVVFYKIVFGDKSSKLNVEIDKISIEEVKHDVFQDYIAVIGTTEPIKTIYLDAIEGGKVDHIIIEEGNPVQKGDVIAKLSNTQLVLTISTNEASVERAINDLKNTRFNMQNQQNSTKTQILQLKYGILKQKRAYERNKVLFAEKHISEEEFKTSEEDYKYSVERMKMLQDKYEQDSIFMRERLEASRSSLASMQENLDITKQRLDNLNVRASVDGELAALNLEIGQVIGYGTRIGRINVLDSYKLRVEIDEYYIANIRKGLKGRFDFDGKSYELNIKKVYPEVQNGRFAVDMVFTEEIPEKIRIGQTHRIRLELGKSKKGMLLARGGFYQSTGGQWVYVLDESGDFAIKRNIRIGRHNPRYYEVLEGLEVGEKAIVSSYDNFGDNDKLILD